MARLTVEGIEKIEQQLARPVSREQVKAIIMAGAEAAETEWKNLITWSGHIRSGGMRNAVQSGDYTETMGGGKAVVYPRGNAPGRKISQAAKAYIINYGRGGHMSALGRMGDRFLTDANDEMEQLVVEAMKDKAREIIE